MRIKSPWNSFDDDPKYLDPLMGSWPLTGASAKVYKCEEGEA